MSDHETRPSTRPACEQIDLRPAGGDVVPDRYGLASQSTACFSPGVAKTEVGNVLGAIKQWATEPSSDSRCDEAYSDGRYRPMEQMAGMPLCRLEEVSALGVGLGLRSVSGKLGPSWLRAVLKGGKSETTAAKDGVEAASPTVQEAVEATTPAAKGKLTLLEGNKGKSLVADAHAVMEIAVLAASGRCPVLAGVLTTPVREVIPRILTVGKGGAKAEYIVVETRSEAVMVSVFSRNGEQLLGAEGGLPLGTDLAMITRALERIVASAFSRGPGHAG